MRKFKKVLALSMVMAMTVASLAGCGGNGGTETTTAAPAANGDTTAATTVAPASNEGQVLNIYVWNEEFKIRVTDHYPGYVKIDDTQGTIGDVKVMWHTTPSDDNAYQKNLDETLLKQDSASADNKIDMFLIEADYALKYVDTDYTMPIADLGITDAELSNQYQYTKDIVTDSNGVLKGISWQGCPGVLIYRRSVAKAVFGTDEPAEIQKKLSDWDTFNKTAEEVKASGYYMVSGYDDTYRVFSNNVTSPWVVDGKVVIDDNIMNWVEQTKEFTDKGYNNKTSLWNDAWTQGFTEAGKVFCYFGPAWFVDFSLGGHGTDGDWAACEGPEGFFWGGTWICAAAGTDNPSLVADIMRQLTTNTDIMKQIVIDDNDFVNDIPAMEAMAADATYQNKVLGGQNPLPMFCAGAETIDLSNLSAYDQGCNEEFQGAMKDYFDGNSTLEDAIALFKRNIVVKYPELKAE